MPAPNFKKPNIRSKAHLKLVRQLPSCLSGRPGPSDPHHLRISEERGVGLKAGDNWAVPLTRREHIACHKVGSKMEELWFFERGIDCRELAKELWKNTGDLDAMTKIVLSKLS